MLIKNVKCVHMEPGLDSHFSDDIVNNAISRQACVALVGAGNFARHQHLPNLHRLPNAVLSWVCDRNTDTLAYVQKQYGCRTTTNLRDVLTDPAVDMVVIALRDDLQADVSIQALEAGKHVYVEKPLARTPEEAADIKAAVTKSGKRLAVGFNRRYAPMYQAIKKRISKHGIGTMHLRMCDDAWRWGHSYEPGFLMGLDAGHLFDLSRWLTNAEVERVCCLSSRADDDQILLHLSNGTVATLMMSAHGSMDMPKERCEIMSNQGGVIGEDFVELRSYGFNNSPFIETFPGHSHPDHGFMHRYLLEHSGAEGFARLRRSTWEQREKVARGAHKGTWVERELDQFVAQTIPNFLRDQGWLAAMDAFIQSIIDQVPSDHADVDDALATAKILAACRLSRETQQVVPVAGWKGLNI